MSSSLSISPTSTPTQQRQQVVDYIRLHLQDFTFRDDNHSYLPLPIINSIATATNIKAVIVQDPVLAADYVKRGVAMPPTNSYDFLTNKIFKYAKRCFVNVMYAQESMYFLRQLTNEIDDGNLPIDERGKIEEGLKEALDEFVGFQPLFCAPVMRLGEYEQEVIMVPLVRVLKEGAVAGERGVHGGIP